MITFDVRKAFNSVSWQLILEKLTRSSVLDQTFWNIL